MSHLQYDEAHISMSVESSHTAVQEQHTFILRTNIKTENVLNLDTKYPVTKPEMYQNSLSGVGPIGKIKK